VTSTESDDQLIELLDAHKVEAGKPARIILAHCR
jgi:hypothetical protein